VVTILDVYFGGQACGQVEQTSTGNLTFRYLEEYRSQPGATPLSLSMPLVAREHPKKSILPFLQGLLPDSEGALKAIADRYGVSPKNPFALLTHIGADVAGALQLLPEGAASPTREPFPLQLRPVTEAEVGDMLRAAMTRYEEGIESLATPGLFSLAGAQPKIVLSRSGRSWAVPENHTPTTHILKPVPGALRRVDIVEQITMSAAAHLGNRVATTWVSQIDGTDVLVSERYDRSTRGGRVLRTHQEDLCQALAVSPAKKYQRQDGGPGVRDIARLIRSLPREQDRVNVGRDFFRALVFNIVTGCTDAHAKNYSLLLEANTVALAPLYDLVSYAAYWDGERAVYSAMSIDGEYSLNKISRDALVTTGGAFGVGGEAEEIVTRTVSGALEAFALAREEVVSHFPEAKAVADVLVNNLARLPLIRSERES
jgi:serine/threonine-protein kinase HipA